MVINYILIIKLMYYDIEKITDKIRKIILSEGKKYFKSDINNQKL